MMKTCSTCEVDQPLTSYHKKAGNKLDGHTNVCKSCCKAYSSKWRGDNVDKLREDKAQEYLLNEGKYKLRAAKWKQDNRGRATELNAKRRAGRASATTNHEDNSGMYSLARKLNELTGSNLQVDHIEPLVHPDICGLHNGHNFQLLSSTLNTKKSNRRDYQTPMDKLHAIKGKRLTIPTC
jgi:hypothetical protein